MKITVIGCGHLGAAHAACMAEVGHEVLGVDIEESKVGLLNSGRAWFYEPGLDEMLARNVAAGHLRFTTSFAQAGAFGEAHFLCVATPGLPESDACDLSQLTQAARLLAPHLEQPCLIIGKSTVPPGTAASLQELIATLAPAGRTAEVAWNPEFMREGHAVDHKLWPDRIVAGVSSKTAELAFRQIYAEPIAFGAQFMVTDLVTAELVKMASNAFLALKISFINALDGIGAAVGANAGTLADALGADPRIGRAFLTAGVGYGGPSIASDIRALMNVADGCGVTAARDMLAVVDRVNQERRDTAVALAWQAAGQRKRPRIAVWGAAFKAGTDDVRDSPALEIADRLHRLGARVTVYDPVATGHALAAFPHLRYADTAIEAAHDADVLVIATAWLEFEDACPETAGVVMRRKVLVDACRATDTRRWEAAGWSVPAASGDSDAGEPPPPPESRLRTLAARFRHRRGHSARHGRPYASL
jgi:UDPglucose 6-dehydrogenase